MRRTVFGLMLLCIFGCQKYITSKNELLQYINDPKNHLTQTEDFGDVKISLTYYPWQLLENTFKKQIAITKSNLRKNADLEYFIIGFSAHDKELLRQLEYNQYSALIQVLSFNMKEYISLVSERKRPIYPVDVLFQPTYGMSSSNQLIVAFKKADLTNTNHLRLKINEFGLNTGNIFFKIDKSSINKIPPIALN